MLYIQEHIKSYVMTKKVIIVHNGRCFGERCKENIPKKDLQNNDFIYVQLN